MIVALAVALVTLAFLALMERSRRTHSEAALWEHRNELAELRAKWDRRDTEAGARMNAIEKRLSGIEGWLGNSHEPWLQRHEGRISGLNVKLQAYTGHLDARLLALTETVARLPSDPATAVELAHIGAWRALAKERRVLARGETGSCEGIRLAFGSRPILVIAFSGMRDNFAWMSRLQSLDVNVLHVVDTSDTWYTEGCDGARRIDWMLQMIAESRGQFNCETVVVMGQSMGGYAALRFGPELSADLVLAFAPQTRFLPEASRTGVTLRNPPPSVVDARPAILASATPTHIFVSASEDQNPPSSYFWDDYAQIDGLQDAPHVKVHVVNCHDHITSHHIAIAGLMDDVLESVFALARGGPARIDLDRLLH